MKLQIVNFKKRRISMFKSCYKHIIYKYILFGDFSENAGGVKMKLITLHLPEPYLEALDRLVNEKLYPNRAEAIRAAVRDLIESEVWRRKRVG